MGQTKEQKIIKQLAGKQEYDAKVTPIATGMILPNLSGDHSAGIVKATPTAALDIVNKAYCDANPGPIPTLQQVTDAGATTTNAITTNAITLSKTNDTALAINGVRFEDNTNFDYFQMDSSGARQLRLNFSVIHPVFDNLRDLGLNTQRWKNLYLAGNLSDGTNSVTIAELKAAVGYSKIGSLGGEVATLGGDVLTIG